MPRKPIPRVPDAEPPPYSCGTCWFYEPEKVDHGACYAIPPTPVCDGDGDLVCPRSIVLPEDRGCIHWRARHTA